MGEGRSLMKSITMWVEQKREVSLASRVSRSPHTGTGQRNAREQVPSNSNIFTWPFKDHSKLVYEGTVAPEQRGRRGRRVTEV